jgi:hypothetical protein
LSCSRHAATQHRRGQERRGAAPAGAGPQEGVSLIYPALALSPRTNHGAGATAARLPRQHSFEPPDGCGGRITHANLVRRGEQGPASRSNARLPRRTALIRNSPCHRVPRCGAAFAEDKAGAGPQEGVSLMAARAGAGVLRCTCRGHSPDPAEASTAAASSARGLWVPAHVTAPQAPNPLILRQCDGVTAGSRPSQIVSSTIPSKPC